MKKAFISIYFLLIAFAVVAQVAPDYRYVKSWHLREKFADKDTIEVDTVPMNFIEKNPVDRSSISNSYNGNQGSPLQSRLYFDRPASTDFIFSSVYEPYILNVEKASFYNTKTPYSNIYYSTGGKTNRKEDNIKFLFTANANKNSNGGFILDYLSSPGQYNMQASKRFAGALFGYYNGKHYSATGFFSFNKLKNQENGGLANISQIDQGYYPENYTTNLSAQSNYVHNQLYYNHQYSVGFERAVQVKKDSVRYDYIPVTVFAHTLKYDDESKRYYENTVNTSFYDNTYGVLSYTKDSTSLQTLRNTFSLSMAEEFNKLMQFGLRAYAENEIQRYVYTKDNMFKLDFQSSTRVGAVLSKERGRQFRYNLLGELTFMGYKSGDFRFEGTVGGYFKLWKDSVILQANGFIRNEQPSHYYQYYESNHFRWNKDFARVFRSRVGGTLSIPTRSFSLNANVENVTQTIYFDSTGIPRQFSGNVQVVAVNLKKDFHAGSFTLENNIVYQLSSNQKVIALPAFTFYHNLYYHDLWFHVLSVQMGVNLKYHSLYYAPVYMPATGQFCNQEKTKIGNYPLMNAYLNFHLKRTRFFVEYYNISSKFVGTYYQSMPGYLYNPAIIKTGISWNFYD